MPIASRNASGCRHRVATALNAPIDAPAVNFVKDGPDELTRVSNDEIVKMQAAYARRFETELKRVGKTLIKRRRIAA